ncbi:MAG: sensor histidine kinase [bacterium]
MKLRLHHVLLVTVGATLLLTNAVILFIGFQQRSADIQKAYHDHFHLTSKVFAYRSFFVIQGGMEKQLPYYLSGLLTDQIFYYVITDSNKKVLISSFDSESQLSDHDLSIWSQGKIENTQNVILSSKDQSYGIQKMVGRLRSFLPGTLTPQGESMISDERVYEVEVKFGDTRKLDVLDTRAAFMYMGFQEYESSLFEYLNDYRIFLNLFFTTIFILFFSYVFSGWFLAPMNQLQRYLNRFQQRTKKTTPKKFAMQVRVLDPRRITAHTVETQHLLDACKNFQDNLLHSLQVVQKTHHQMQAATDGIQESYVSLEQTQRQLVQSTKMAAVGEMLAMIAHQWRQPLSVIGMITSGLTLKVHMNKIDTAFTDEIDKLQHQIRFLSRTIEDFRNFFRPNDKLESVQLGDIVTLTVKMFEPILQKSAIEVQTELIAVPSIRVHQSELQQVIMNLLKNAMDALVEKQPKLRQIKIRVGQNENRQILEVQDNAGGIDEEIIDRIFDPYFTTKGKLNGTGLGLYMSKLIIEEHLRGKLFVQNQDSGANFRIELPC